MPKRLPKRIAVFLAAAVLMAGCASSTDRRADRSPAGAPVEQPSGAEEAESGAAPAGQGAQENLPEAPDFTIEATDGSSFTLSALRGERPVLLNFWAPW